MEVGNQHNQSYLFVVMKDHDNVTFSSNNCDKDNPPIAEQKASCIVDTGDDRQYIQLNNVEATATEAIATEAIATNVIGAKVIRIEVIGTEILETDAIGTEAIGTESIGTEALGTEVIGTEVIGTEVIAAEVIGTELTATEAIGTEVIGIEFIETEVIAAEVIGTEVIATEVIGTEVIASKAVGTEAIGTEVIGTEVIGTEVIGTEVIGTEVIASEAIGTEVIGTEVTATEVIASEAIGTEVTGTEVIGTEPIATEVSATEPITKNHTKNILMNNKKFWNRRRIKLLLTLCLDRRFKCPDTDKILFNEISILIRTTPKECEKKYTYLRSAYLSCLRRKKLGKDFKWIHFRTCDRVFKQCKTLLPVLLETWKHSKNKQLLKLYIENIKQFRNNKNFTQKEMWKDIASKLDTTEYNCFHKFISLKRKYFKLVHKSKETGKSMKWPYRHYFERIYNNYRRNLKVWDKNKIRILINAYLELAHKFKSPKYQKKELWKEIGLKVGENADQCDRKFRNLKQTYIALKSRSDSSMKSWRYYKDFAAVFEKTPYTPLEDEDETPLDQDTVRQMLSFCVRNKDKFKDPIGRKRMLWKQISSKLGLTPEQCANKFRNMKRTYFKLVEKKRKTGKSSCWQYFSYFEQIYGIKKPKRDLEKYNIDNLPMPEIRNLVKNLQSKDADNFDNLLKVIEDSNSIQRERNRILQALLDKQ